MINCEFYQKFEHDKKYVRSTVNFKLSNHAQKEMVRRNIPQNLIDAVLNTPQQIVEEKDGRKAYQSKLDFGQGRMYLLRVIVVDQVDPAVVVTVYRTTKIDKYWRSS